MSHCKSDPSMKAVTVMQLSMPVTAFIAGSALQGAIQGGESAVDHYTAYISSDGQNLMPLTDIAAGTHGLDLCSFAMPKGTYHLFLQVVGKPSLANQITTDVHYTPACGSGTAPPPPTLSFSASPSAVSIPAGKSGSLTVTLQTH